MDVSEVCPAVEDLMCDKSEDGVHVLSYFHTVFTAPMLLVVD
jgi:hypothetical protein